MYEEISANVRRSWLLIFSFVFVIAALGWIIGEITGFGLTALGFALVLALVLVLVSYYQSDSLVLAISGAHPADPKEYPHLHNSVEGLAIAAGIPKPKVYVINDTSPNALAAGRDPEHAVVAFTTGLLEKMDRLELEGVVAHEISHIKNYDVRLMTLTVVLVGVVLLLSDFLLRSFWWGGGRGGRRQGQGQVGMGLGILLIIGLGLALLSPLFARLIKLAVSRRREYLADASGAMLTRYPLGLASALKKLAADPEPLKAANKATAHLYISSPKQRSVGGKVRGLWTTHPPTEERIKRLESMGGGMAAQE
jgi:heat shock protein HtpX